MSDFLKRLAEAIAGGGGATFGGKTYGGQTFGGNTFGGNQFGASAPPRQGPVTVQASLPQLPAYEAPGDFSNKHMPIGNYMPPQAAMMPPSQPRPQMAPAPQASQPPMMGFDPNPPMSMEMQGVNQFAAPHPTGRNELERDYYAQLAQNPNGFDKPDWLKRWLG